MHRSHYKCFPNPDGTKGWIWNPITGSLSDCPNPNARKLANTRLRNTYLANINVAPINLSTHPSKWAEAVNRKALTDTLDPFYPRFWEEKLLPAHRIGSAGYVSRKAKGIFVCDMSDLFGIGIPQEWQERVFSSIKTNPLDRFYLLTKQPQNLAKFQFPDNCWVGVSATDTRMALEACLRLGDIEAKVRYLSIEPMLTSINLPYEHLKVCKIDQLIIGSQTKPYKPPKIEWVREIVEVADKAGVKVFLKDNLNPLFAEATTIKDKWVFSKTNFMRGELYRQEMPV